MELITTKITTMQALLKNLSQFTKKTHQIFGKKHLERLGRKAGYHQRKGGKLDAYRFVHHLVQDASNCYSVSISGCCLLLKNKFRLGLSTQGLWARYQQAGSLRFMQTLLQELCSLLVVYPSQFSGAFSEIQLLDSSTFKLPDCLRSFFKGTKKGSSLKLQLEYQLFSGHLIGLEPMSGTTHDALYGDQNLERVPKGGLLLRDLGYTKKSVLEWANNNDSYLLSRLHSGWEIYEQVIDECGNFNYHPIDRIALVQKIKSNTEKVVYLSMGNKQFAPVRLLIMPVSDQVVSQRQRAIHKRAKSHKRQAQKVTLEMAKASWFWTNASSQQLPMEHALSLYALRWQIEIIFKGWKSGLKTMEFPGIKGQRLMVLLYAKLIQLCLAHKIIFAIRKVLWELEKKELSELKAYKLYQKFYIESIVATLQQTSEQLFELILKIKKDFDEYAIKQRKKGCKTPQNILYNTVFQNFTPF